MCTALRLGLPYFNELIIAMIKPGTNLINLFLSTRKLTNHSTLKPKKTKGTEKRCLVWYPEQKNSTSPFLPWMSQANKGLTSLTPETACDQTAMD
jgi:hypothetical protein